MRGLQGAVDSPTTLLSREEARLRITAAADELSPKREARLDRRLLAALGLYDWKLIPRDAMIEADASDASGWYDIETGEVVVVSDDDVIDAAEEVAYAHEVTHALQADAFDLAAGWPDARAPRNTDARLAWLALAEGDTTATEVAYLWRHPNLTATIRDAPPAAPNATGYRPPLPQMVERVRFFPYEAGHLFVQYLLHHGGWPMVNDAYTDPPVSTEQILHPDRYWQRDRPTPVALPDLTKRLGPDWRLLTEDTFGELRIRKLLEQMGAPIHTYHAAAGWDGDRLAMWANGAETLVVWESVWNGERDAAEFAVAMRRLYGGSDLADLPGAIVTEPGEHAWVVVASGARVIVILAPAPAVVATVLASFPAPVVGGAGETDAAALWDALGGSIARPAPTECVITPRTVASLQQLLGTSPAETEPGRRDSAAFPRAADAEETAAISATVREELACVRADEPLRLLALSTGDAIRRDWTVQLPPTPADIARLADPPWAARVRTYVFLVALGDVQRLSDGRAAALVVSVDGAPHRDLRSPVTTTRYVVFALAADRWKFDEVYAYSG